MNQTPGLGRVSLWAKITQMFFLSGSAQACPQHLNSSAYGPRKHQSRHHKCVMYQSTASGTPVCERGWCATISQSSSATAPSRWPAAIRRADFYGAPRRSHLSCHHLCLPPAIGQGPYNRRVGGGPGPVEDGTAAKQVCRRGGAGIGYCGGKGLMRYQEMGP